MIFMKFFRNSILLSGPNRNSERPSYLFSLAATTAATPAAGRAASRLYQLERMLEQDDGGGDRVLLYYTLTAEPWLGF